MTILAIDFGTSRIKVAYVASSDGRPRLWSLGQNERPWLPSLVYLGKDGSRMFGDEADAADPRICAICI